MTPAEIAAQLADRGWTQAGSQLKAMRYVHSTHGIRPALLLVDDGAEARLFREVHPDHLAMILAGGGPPR